MIRFKAWLKNSATFLAASLLCVVMAEIVLCLVPGLGASYRPHGRLLVHDSVRGLERYRRNKRVTMRMPHGDLAAITSSAVDFDTEPRDVSFEVDSQGFRNSFEHAGSEIVLVGDSFVVGNGNSQEKILSSQLMRMCGLRAYNVAIPASPFGYLENLQAFERETGTKVRIVLLLFEGNDFPVEPAIGSELGNHRQDRGASSAVLRWMQGRRLYRLAASAYHVARRKMGVAGPANVSTFALGIHRLGFLNKYIAVSEQRSYSGHPALKGVLQELAERAELIAFIPTKYRVYHGLIEPGGPAPDSLPHVRWEYLERLSAGWQTPTLDLTGELVSESGRLLEEDRFTFWKDDTHWNEHGIAVAARAVCETLYQPSLANSDEDRAGAVLTPQSSG